MLSTNLSNHNSYSTIFVHGYKKQNKYILLYRHLTTNS